VAVEADPLATLLKVALPRQFGALHDAMAARVQLCAVGHVQLDPLQVGFVEGVLGQQ
jgi:hypothetical protein